MNITCVTSSTKAAKVHECKPLKVCFLLLCRRTRQYQAIREQGDILSAARAEADTTLERHAPHIASTSALSALLKGFRACDKDRSGRLQANEFSAVLRHAGLGLSQQEVRAVLGFLEAEKDVPRWRLAAG